MSRRTIEKSRNKGMAIMLVAVLLVVGFVYVFQEDLGITLSTFDRTPPGEIAPDAELVDLSIKVAHELDRDNPAATPIRVYDSNMDFIESASTSSGVATFLAPYWEGETIYLQARASAPNSATFVTYTTPLLEYVIPEGDVNGDAELPILNLWEVSTGAATFNVVDQLFKAKTDSTVSFINATDTELTVTIAITSDCAYGTPEDFKDGDTGKNYLSGVWLVFTSTAAQATLNNYVAHFYANSLEYYVFRVPMIVNDADLGYQTGRTLTLGDGVTAFVASAAVTIDIYDICWANSVSDISATSFMNGDSDLNPTAISTKVA